MSSINFNPAVFAQALNEAFAAAGTEKGGGVSAEFSVTGNSLTVTVKGAGGTTLTETMEMPQIDAPGGKIDGSVLATAFNKLQSVFDVSPEEFESYLQDAADRYEKAVQDANPSKRKQNLFVDVYAVLALLHEMGRMEKEVSVKMRETATLQVQKSIEGQAARTRAAAWTGLACAAVAAGVSIGYSVVSSIKSGQNQSVMDTQRNVNDVPNSLMMEDNAAVSGNPVKAAAMTEQFGSRLMECEGGAAMRAEVNSSLMEKTPAAQEKFNSANARLSEAMNAVPPDEQSVLEAKAEVETAGRELDAAKKADAGNPVIQAKNKDLTNPENAKAYRAELEKAVNGFGDKVTEAKAEYDAAVAGGDPIAIQAAGEKLKTAQAAHAYANSVKISLTSSDPNLSTAEMVAADKATAKTYAKECQSRLDADPLYSKAERNLSWWKTADRVADSTAPVLNQLGVAVQQELNAQATEKQAETEEINTMRDLANEFVGDAREVQQAALDMTKAIQDVENRSIQEIMG